MDKLALGLGITGTGGVICVAVAYLISKGFKSKCLAATVEMSVDIHKTDKNQNDTEKTIGTMNRVQLEEIIVEIMTKQTQIQIQMQGQGQGQGQNQSQSQTPGPAVNVSNTSNIVIPINPRGPSHRDIQDMIKEKILEARANDEYTRSRSGSEDSHRSHKSHNSKGKEDNFNILKEEL